MRLRRSVLGGLLGGAALVGALLSGPAALASVGFIAGSGPTLPGVTPGTPSPDAHPLEVTPGPRPLPPSARLTLTSVTPELVTGSATVQVQGRLLNTGKTPLSGVSVRLRAVGGRLGTRIDVGHWLTGQDLRTGYPMAPASTLDGAIGPGVTAPFTLEVPAGALGLAGQEFGAYPLLVEARASADSGLREQVAMLRTTIQWQPSTKQYAAQRITWIVPFSALPPATGGSTMTAAQVAAAVAPGQRLRRLLEAASAPGVAWAVDPQLLLTLQQVAQGAGTVPDDDPSPTVGGTSAPATDPTGTGTATGAPTGGPAASSSAREQARSFLRDMRSAAVGRVVVELPYADPDLQAVSDARGTGLLPAARAAGEGTLTEVLAVTPLAGVSWPAGGYASDPLIEDLVGQGIGTVVLDGRSRPLVDALSYTPDARTTSVPGGAVAVLADGQLSQLMARVRADDSAARGQFLAETAAATSERPGLSRRLLIALPRSLDPDPVAFRSLIEATSSVPWLAPIPFSDLLSPIGARGDAAQLARRAVPEPDRPATRGVRPPDIEQTLALRRDLAALGEVVTNPVSLTAGLQRDTLALVSAVWRGHRAVLSERLTRERTAVDQLTGQVRVLPTTITFLRSSGQLQLTVTNDLDQRVDGLRLQVIAPTPRLVVQQQQSEPISLAPHTRTSVRIPVRAIASGQVLLQAQLVTPSGATLGQSEEVQVRVRPTDSWVLSVGGVIVAVAVLVGLVRALRRPRRGRGES